MLVGSARLAKRVLQDGDDFHDTVAARRTATCENDFAHEAGLLLRDDLRDEPAEREANIDVYHSGLCHVLAFVHASQAVDALD